MTKKLGFVLIILSFVFYGLILVVPFLKVTVAYKASITTFLIIFGEISFWVGGIMLGKEIVSKYRKLFNVKNWYKRKKQSEQDNS